MQNTRTPTNAQVAELSWRNGRRNSQCKFSSVRWSETSNGSSDSRNLSMSTMLYLVFQLGNGGLGGQSRRRRRGLRSFNYIEGKRRRRRGLRVKQRCGEATASLPPHRNRKADKVLAHMPNMMRAPSPCRLVVQLGRVKKSWSEATIQW